VESELARIVEHPALRAVLEHLPCVLYIGRPSWPPTVDFISANVERFIGYAPADFYADPMLALKCIHPEDRERAAASIRRAMTRAEPYRLEYRVVHRNGADVLHAESLSVATLGADGQVVQRQGIILDITEKKRLESELMQSQRLAVVGEMAAMMAHEIRNPLTGMVLAIRALRPIAGHSSAGKGCLDDLERCVERINDTVSRALEFAKVQPLTLQKCRLHDIVAAALRMTATYLGSHRIEQEVNVSPDLPGLVADPRQLEQVFINLILNACKAMPDGGRLSLRSWVMGQHLAVEVSDTGAGVAPGELERIFSPLPSRFGEGSALGLPLCQRIVAAHGGSIHVESAPGTGRTFRILLPLEPAYAPRPPD